MTLGRAFSVAVRGLEGEIVEIEADITSGCPAYIWSGCPTPHCRNRETACAPQSPTVAIAGRWPA